MKKTLCFAVLIICLLSVSALADAPEVSAKCAILTCADTGDVLYEKNADERSLIASTTKIMTAIVAIENCDLNEEVLIDTEWCLIEGSSMYLEAGKTYTVEELLTGMMLTSGNDAATALACYVAGSEAQFARLMNEKAAKLGMINSSFENPHGLDGENQYSTAADLAVLAAYCMENSTFRELAAMKSATIGELTFINHNKLLWSCEGCRGIKTGYTIAAGRTLVSCCERNGMRLVCVTLNAPDDWNDHAALYDWGYSEYSLTVFRGSDFFINIPTVSGFSEYAAVTVENDIVFLTELPADVDVEIELPRFLFSGGFKGDRIGKLRVYFNGVLEAETDLVYTEDDPVNIDNKRTAAELFFAERIRPYYIR